MAFKIGQKIGSYINDDYKENEYLNAHCEFCNKIPLTISGKKQYNLRNT